MARVWTGQVTGGRLGHRVHVGSSPSGDQRCLRGRTRMSGASQSVRGRLWRPSRRVVDSGVVVALCAVATALALTPALRGLGDPDAALMVLTVGTAAATDG